MSAEPPPPPQVSPDGKFYWDGQRWVPMMGQVPLQPPPQGAPPPVTVVKQPRGAWNSCVGYGCIGIALLFVFVAFTAWCGTNHPPTSSSPSLNVDTSLASQPPPAAQQAPVTMSAEGNTKTALFTLARGDYTITYDFRGQCFYGAFLEPNGGDFATGTGPIQGVTHLYGVKAGSYYINMISGPPPACPWTIVFTRN